MTHKPSLLANIISRKIPQIIGVYIAAVWIGVEISDWMSGRFELPEQFAAYVFVGMLSMLPTVILVAWGHGKPGKDVWTAVEKAWIPINLTLALFASIYFVKPQEVNSLPVDSQAEVLVSTVANLAVKNNTNKSELTQDGLHQTVVAYFWDNQTNDQSLEWVSYGASWLLAQDLKRTPLISVLTPYAANRLFSQLLEKGFDKALHIPLSLAKKLAQSHSAKWLIDGSFKKINDQLELTASLYNVKTGKQVTKLTYNDENWLVALDKISNEFGKIILTTANVSSNIIPELAILAHTSDNLKAIELFILARNLVLFENDYNAGLTNLFSALELDDTFAQVHVVAMQYYSVLGDFPKAIEQAKKALGLDYKLYKETLFLVKASLLGLQGENAKAIKVLEKWVDLYPDNTEALRILGKNYIVVGNHQEQAKETYIKLYEKAGEASTALINLGKIYRLQNDQENAIMYLTKYKNARPTEGRAYFELADAYKQFAQLDKAKKMYEEASLFSNNDIKADIGLAKIVAAKGDYTAAIATLYSLLDKSKSEQQTIDILATIQAILMQTGQLNKALAINDKLFAVSAKIMTPLQASFQVKGTKIYLYTLLGQFKEADAMVTVIKKDLKPPFDKLIGVFEKFTFEIQEDIENYKKSLSTLEELTKSLNLATMKPDILRSKGKLAFWAKNYAQALDYYNKAIHETKQSFVTLLTSQQVDDFYYEKALTLIALEKFDKAIESLDIILARSPLFARANHLKAVIYHKLDNTDKLKLELATTNATWKNADENYIDYKKFKQFEKSLTPSSS
ncbi:MAG: hypothetical protein L3J53_03790 [Proteobacteria bacterium]|nr:hypothetical protein [Pseudomonadota bacterium]